MQHFSERYTRQLQLPGFGAAAQQLLASASVLVVGAGGLGASALQYLTGMGVGTIGIADDDVVRLSNLHRQVLYATEDIGQPKALVAAAKLVALNPEIKIQALHTKLHTDNALSIIHNYDLILDATDNFSARYLINDACIVSDKPFVYGAIHRYEGHVSVFNFNGGPTYRCLYPIAPVASEIPDCNDAGMLGVVPGMVGCRQALEAIKIITGIGKNLSGYLLVSDFLNDEQYKIKLKAVPANRQIKILQENYDLACMRPVNRLRPYDLWQWLQAGKPFLLLDIREPDEFAAGHLPAARNFAWSSLKHSIATFDPACPIVLYCQKGTRSAKAVAMIRQEHPELNLFDLAGGIDAWLNDESAL